MLFRPNEEYFIKVYTEEIKDLISGIDDQIVYERYYSYSIRSKLIFDHYKLDTIRHDTEQQKNIHLSFILYALFTINVGTFVGLNALIKALCPLDWWYDEHNNFLRLFFTYNDDVKMFAVRFDNLSTMSFGRVGELICMCLFLDTKMAMYAKEQFINKITKKIIDNTMRLHDNFANKFFQAIEDKNEGTIQSLCKKLDFI